MSPVARRSPRVLLHDQMRVLVCRHGLNAVLEAVLTVAGSSLDEAAAGLDSALRQKVGKVVDEMAAAFKASIARGTR